MAQLNDFIASNPGAVSGALGAVSALLLLLVLVLAWRTRRLGRRVDRLTRGASGHDLAGVLEAHLDTVLKVARDLDALTARTNVMEANQRLALQRLGLVRYNPFPDTGGNQSFALALLDANDSGFVLSSLHSRAGTRVYGKAIAAGSSDTALSAEETQALDVARRPAPAPKPAAVKPVRSVPAAAAVPAEAPLRIWGDADEPLLDRDFIARRLSGTEGADGNERPGDGRDGGTSAWRDRPRS